MRVVLLCTQYHEGGGGAEILTHHIAIGLRERGYEVEIWYLYNKFAREKSPWERIVYEGKPCGPASAFAIAGKFISALIGFRPDAIVAFHPLANILGTVAGVFGFVPARVASQHAQATCYRRWLRWLDRVLGSSFVYTRNIVVARTLARTFDDYPAAYRAKLSVVSNSVPGPTEVLGQREARQRCSLPLEGIVIGTVGRLVSQKNQKFLVELIAALPQVHLAIAGAGELRDELVDFISQDHSRGRKSTPSSARSTFSSSLRDSRVFLSRWSRRCRRACRFSRMISPLSARFLCPPPD